MRQYILSLFIALCCIHIHYSEAQTLKYGGRYAIQDLQTIVATGFEDFKSKANTGQLLQARAPAKFVSKTNPADVVTQQEQFLIDTVASTYYMIRNGYNVQRKFNEGDFDSFESQVPSIYSDNEDVYFRFHWKPQVYTYSMSFLNNLLIRKEEVGGLFHSKASLGYFHVINNADGKSIMLRRYNTNDCITIERVTRLVIPNISGFMRTCDPANSDQLFKWDGIRLLFRYDGSVYNICLIGETNSNNKHSYQRGGQLTMMPKVPDYVFGSSNCHFWMREAGTNRDMSTTPATITPVEEWYESRTFAEEDITMHQQLALASVNFSWASASRISMSTILVVFVVLCQLYMMLL
jgi:hypothetical protein